MTWMNEAIMCAWSRKGLGGFANTLVFTAILSLSVDNSSCSRKSGL